ncbi:MAG: hypothetical protein AAF467_22105 [Actinomycetota bacterium]
MEAVERALGPWLRSTVDAHLGDRWSPEIEAEVHAATAGLVTDVGGRLRQLLEADLDDQWTNPLAILRTATSAPTAILAANGVPEVDRDDHARRLHPDDVYDLGPAAFADLGPEVHEHGLMWGAAKAHLHLQRRKRQETT